MAPPSARDNCRGSYAAVALLGPDRHEPTGGDVDVFEFGLGPGPHCAAADLSMFPNVSTCSALSGMVGDVVDCCYGGILPISTPHFNSEGGISGGLHQLAPKLRGSSTYMLVYMWAGPGEDIQRTRDLSGLVGATACAPTLLGPGWTMPHAHSLSAGGLTSTVAGAWFPTSLDPQPDALWRPSVGDR